MKTEKQIRQWAKTHTVHENDVHSIMGYLTALNIDIENDIDFNIGAKKDCFEDFVEWFDITTIGLCGGISLWAKMNPPIDVFEGIYSILLCHKEKTKSTSEHKPKEGEFWFYPKDYNFADVISDGNYSINLSNNFVWEVDGHDYLIDFYKNTQRPCTESEKQQLIKAVEEEYKKTFKGKEWVDMKPKFKRGDYLTEINGNRIIICDHQREDEVVLSSIYFYRNKNNTEIGKNPITCGKNSIYRYSTAYEIQKVDDALAKAGKRFNKQKLELEDILKVGDMVIAWDNGEKEYALVGVLTNIHNSHYNVCACAFENAIKFTSEQQYRDFIKEK